MRLRTDNNLPSYTEPTPQCPHVDAKGFCVMCWYESTGPKVDIELPEEL